MTSRVPDTPEGADREPPLAEHLANRPDRPRAGRERQRSQSRLLLLLLFGLIPMLVVFVVVLNSLGSGPPDPGAGEAQQDLEIVTRYCTYSARTFGGYDDCLRGTDRRVVEREDTNAGRYARGELTRCLADAGPRCTLR
ncbi:hypothetical protein ACVU7I_02920 [Patulibacter sp. S7RM1-6]